MEPTTPPDHQGNSGKPADEGSATADKSATEGQHAFVTIRILGIDGFTHANLAKDRMVVGCSFAADLPIMHTSVTRKHCVFTREGDAWFVENIDSSHGYRVNKPQAVISGKVKLSPNDTIACGQARLTFQLGNATSIHQIKEAQLSEIGKSFTDEKEIAAATSTSADTQRSAKAGSVNGQPQQNDKGSAFQQQVLISLKEKMSAIPWLIRTLFSNISFRLKSWSRTVTKHSPVATNSHAVGKIAGKERQLCTPYLTVRILGTDELKQLSLTKDRMVAGRSHENDLPIMHSTVTREHCVFTRNGDHWFVENIDSSHGHRANKPKVPIRGKVMLSPNDTIACGQARLTFHLGNTLSSQASPHAVAKDPKQKNDTYIEESTKKAAAMQALKNVPSNMSGYLISAVAHGVFAAFFYFAVWATMEKPINLPPMRVIRTDPPPKVEEKIEPRSLEKIPEINIPIQTEVASPIVPLEIPPEEFTTSETPIEANVPLGHEDAVSTITSDSSAAFMTISAGSGSAGLFGNRSGGGKKRALANGGGTPASENAVQAALRWFKRHQSKNGMWSAEKYYLNCSEKIKCEPGRNQTDKTMEKLFDNALTALVLQAFLGAGYDHQMPSQFRETVAKGLKYLQEQQLKNGRLSQGSHENYEIAMVTTCFAEAYAMTNDDQLKQAAQNGFNALYASQSTDRLGRLGWSYSGPEYVDDKDKNKDKDTNSTAGVYNTDVSVTGWVVMALKSGVAAGFDVGVCMTGAQRWLNTAWETTNPRFKSLDPYKGLSVFPYNFPSGERPPAIDLNKDNSYRNYSCFGALCAVFLGKSHGDIMIETLCNYILKMRDRESIDGWSTYCLYYNTITFFQLGGARWEQWNNMVRESLVSTQRKEPGCFDGSWDRADTGAGRALDTALCCLTLEVYYRYKQVHK